MSSINKLLTERDNAEKIRDTIAFILKDEIENQKILAAENKEKDDFDINVFIENARPWNLANEDNNQFPLINVCLQQISKDDKPGSTINKQKCTAVFNIDCWGCGNGKNNDLPDDYLSTIRAWKTARIARNILMAGFYSYLGIRDIVRKREIVSMNTIIPQGLPESAISVTACRIVFEVETFEESPQAEPTVLEALSLIVDDPTGKVNLISISNILKDDEKNKDNEGKE